MIKRNYRIDEEWLALIQECRARLLVLQRNLSRE